MHLDGNAKEHFAQITEKHKNEQKLATDKKDPKALFLGILDEQKNVCFPDTKECSCCWQLQKMCTALFMDLNKFKTVALFVEEITKMNLHATFFPNCPDGFEAVGLPDDETREALDCAKSLELSVETMGHGKFVDTFALDKLSKFYDKMLAKLKEQGKIKAQSNDDN